MTSHGALMPAARTAAVNGIEMGYYEVCEGQGVPVIFCHGFPELAFSWRHQLRAFEAAGRWAIAPDQRGYGLTSRPETVSDYDMEHLTGDLVALLDHKGIDKAIFCGHDWGGFVVWQMALMHPDRCAGVIGVNTPFMPRSPIDPIEGMRAMFGEKMYIVWFQTPGEADAALGADAEKTMRFFMRRPDTQAAQAAIQAAAQGSPPDLSLGEMLKAWDGGVTRDEFLTPEELAFFVETFRRTGFTGGINWYRNFSRNWQRSTDLPTRIDGKPCLMIMAENDVVLSPAMAEGMENHIGDLEKALVRDSGHWTQQEQPEEVNRLILDWMDRRFPK